jgi:hypothetical protein
MATLPPPQTAAARPRYLVVALIAALVFGAGCWTEGCARLQLYRGGQDGAAALNEQIRDDADRAEVEALYKRFIDVADGARGRGVPLAAATFVLGAALLAFAARGLAGRTNARSALIQVVSAQAILVVATWFVMRDVSEAELDWHLARTLAQQREALPPDELAKVAPVVRDARHYGGPAWLVIRTVASALIVVALTRRRSRAFFDAASAPAPEQ